MQRQHQPRPDAADNRGMGDDYKRMRVGGTPPATYIAWPPGYRRWRFLRRCLVAAVVAAGLAFIAWDMRRHGVPLTFHGLRWWLSLWIRA